MSHKRIMFFPAAVGALVVLIGAALLFALRPATFKRAEGASKHKPPAAAEQTAGQPLPKYRLAELNQRELSPDELRQGRVLLVYLTTSCEACIKDLDVVTRLQRDAPSDLRIYGVSVERQAQVETFIKEFDLSFPVLLDIGGGLARGLDIHYFPSKYLVEDGIITRTWRGATQDEAGLRQQLGMK